MKTHLIVKSLFIAIVLLIQTRGNAQWISSNVGLDGGPINDLKLNGSNLFAATPGGVYLSSNNGVSWSAVNSGLSSTYINCLATNNGIIYAGTNQGVFLSTNNGTSWTGGGPTLLIGVLSIVATNENIFAGTQQGVYRSIDNGVTWIQVNTGLTNANINSLSISGNNIFAGTPSGLFVSSNNGSSWSITSLPDNIISLASNGINLFAGTLNGLYRSTDEGVNWIAINSGLPPGFLVFFLAFDNGKVYASTSSGVSVSTNNGTDWTSTTSFTETQVEAIVVGNGNIFAGTASDVFRSTDDGASWTTANTGLANTDVRAFAINGSTTFVGTFGNGVHLSGNAGSSWVDANSGLSNKNVKSLTYSGTSFFAGTFAGVFVSSNNGATWVTGGLGEYTNALITSNNNIFAGTFGGGVYLSTNNGSNWTAVNSGLTNTFVYSLAINGSSIFAGTGNGVFLSSDNGSSWLSVSDGLPLNSIINSLAFHNGNLFAATDAGLFISGNNGLSWQATTIPDAYMNVVMVSDNNIFAATGFGNLYLSKNNGGTWRNVGSSTTGWGNYVSIGSLIVSASNLLVGTNRGVWSRSLEDVLKEPQTITFNALALKTYGDAPFNLTATSSSGLAVTYTSSDPTVASISSNSVTILKAGSTTITASQAGDNNFKPAIDVVQTLTVDKASQEITFAALPTKVIGDAAISLSASSSSGLPVEFSSTSTNITISNSNQVVFLNAGSATITASQVGDQNYKAATPVSRTFCIIPTKPIITVTNPTASTPTLTSSSASANQWFLNGSPISGAINPTYTVTQSGSYKVQVTIDGCASDFSIEEPLVVTGDILNTNISIDIHPNPTTKWLTISLGIIEGRKDITLYNINGSPIASQEVSGNSAIFDVSDFPTGLYLARISNKETTKVMKFIKQ